MKRSLRVATSGNIYSTIDPPLRYVPLAILFWILNITTVGPEAAYITHLYSTMMSYVVLPATLYLLVRETIDRKAALLVLLGVISWRLLGIGLNAYIHGYWMYDYTIPFIFIALTIAHRTILEDRQHHRFLLAAGTGFAVGVVGLNEYILGAYTAGIVAVLFIFHNRIRELILTGSIGAVMASSLMFMSSYAKDFIISSGDDRLKLLTVTAIPGNVIDIITTPAYMLPVGLVVVAGVLYHWTRSPPTSSGVLVAACIVLGIGWHSRFVLSSGWFALLAQYVGQYIVLALAVQQVVDHVDGLVKAHLEELIERGYSSDGRL
ncbi:hypothetical protein DVK01_01555 [Haloarcula sp. Atlit-120R]|nr:hypothetical protein DVK01_01555 [Haloarcula sp. Atlit-120R]